MTTNLLTALRHLRDSNDISLLWVDALCIDQVNVREENIQIQLMSLLYSKAASVLIWLGDNEVVVLRSTIGKNQFDKSLMLGEEDRAH